MDMQSRGPSPFGWLLIVPVVVILIVAPFLATPNDTRQRLSLSEVAILVQTGKVRKLTVLGDRVQGERVDGTRFTSRKERGVALTTTLRALGVSRRATLDRLARRLLEEDTVEGGELAGTVARREGRAARREERGDAV